MPPKAIFKGQTLCISGKLSQPKKDYEELIHKYGGTVKDSVTAAVTLLISNEDDVKACTQKVATAQGRKVPIVQEGYVGACITAKSLLDHNKFLVKGSKRKAAPKAKKAPKKRKVADAGPVVTTDKVGVIAKSGLAGEAAVVVQEVKKSFGAASITWDVELVLNDPEKGTDKFYTMQLLASKAGGQYWCVQNWGKTGMEGAVHIDGPTDSIEDAKRTFKKKYRQKTGNVWGQVDATFVEEPGKYKLLIKDAKKDAEASGTWQYYLHNKVDGKKIGWYDYDEDAGKNMEKYWRQYNTNEGLGVRLIQSDYFKYEVNFTDMIQTNTKSGTRRVIRRVAAGERPSAAAPEKIPEKVAPRADAAEEDSDDEEPEDDDEDEDEAEGEAEEAAEAEEEAAPAEAAEAEEPAEPAAGGRKPPPAEAEAEAEAEAPAAGGRKPPPAAAEDAAEAEAEAPAGGRMPPPDEAEAETQAGSPAAEEDEMMAATLPLGGRKA